MFQTHHLILIPALVFFSINLSCGSSTNTDPSPDNTKADNTQSDNPHQTLPKCGDGHIDAPEVCDGTLLGDGKCPDNSQNGLRCNIDCLGFDTSGCDSHNPQDPINTCGNHTLDDGEACDGTLLGDGKCPDNSQNGLRCNIDCLGFDTSNCDSQHPHDPIADCGNRILDPGELCDINQLNGETCASVNSTYTGGDLQCGHDCQSYDTSQCTS